MELVGALSPVSHRGLHLGYRGREAGRKGGREREMDRERERGRERGKGGAGKREGERRLGGRVRERIWAGQLVLTEEDFFFPKGCCTCLHILSPSLLCLVKIVSLGTNNPTYLPPSPPPTKGE